MVDMMADCTQLFSFCRDHLIEMNDFMCILHVGTGESTCRLCVFFSFLLAFLFFFDAYN